MCSAFSYHINNIKNNGSEKSHVPLQAEAEIHFKSLNYLLIICRFGGLIMTWAHKYENHHILFMLILNDWCFKTHWSNLWRVD